MSLSRPRNLKIVRQFFPSFNKADGSFDSHCIVKSVRSQWEPGEWVVCLECRWPMDQIQVNVAQSKVGHAATAGRLHVLMVGVPQFRDHKQVLARHSAFGDLFVQRLAHFFFVFIQIGGVKVAVAGVDG